MEYIYAAMVIHSAGKDVTEGAVKKVLEAAGAKVDGARAKALVAALEGVNIEEAVNSAALPVAAPAAPAAGAAPAAAEEKKEEKKEEEKPKEEATAGLSSLFG